MHLPGTNSHLQDNTKITFSLSKKSHYLMNMLATTDFLMLRESSRERKLLIRAHSGLGKIPVVLTLLGLRSSLECTTKTSNFFLWGEKVVFLAS